MAARLQTWILGVALSMVASSAFAWFDCDWPYRTEVTVSESSGISLIAYQILLTLSAADFHSDYSWSSAGDDLRVLAQNNVTELPYFIESWDANAETARVWVQLDSLPASSISTLFLYVGNMTASAKSTADTFTESGIKFETRFTAVNPTDKSSAFAAFNAAPLATAGYGCTSVTDFTNINKRNQFSPPSRTQNFGAYSESFFEVASGEAGVWSFRYGADFGRGGGLYVNDVALEESWNGDLWWAFNWGASDDVLEGSITLTEGYHKLEIIGFEGCCDGGITIQYRKPGGIYQTFQTSTINVVSRQCPVQDPAVSFGALLTQLPDLDVVMSPQVLSDPINLDSNPKSLPGSYSQIAVEISNVGSGAPETGSLSFKSSLPENSYLFLPATPFGFTDGPTPSGLTLNYLGLNSVTDNIEFSDDSGLTFDYVPAPDAAGIEPNVTDLRITPAGTMNCATPSGDPSFVFSYQITVP